MLATIPIETLIIMFVPVLLHNKSDSYYLKYICNMKYIE